MSPTIIEVQNVRKSFGETQALAGVDLFAETGRVLALLGPNGAGKTTLVSILSTLLRPDSGRVAIAGLDSVKNASRVRSVIGLTGQYAAVDDLLTGRENLEMMGQLHGLERSEARRRAISALEQYGLDDFGNQQARTYSGGMRRRLDLASSLISRPAVLLLDEPTTGLDPATRSDLWSAIERLVTDGTTVLLTTQYLEEADRLAHQVVVIDRGTVVAAGTPGQLKSDLGGDVIELRVPDRESFLRASRALDGLPGGISERDESRNSLTLPAPAGADSLSAALAKLRTAEVKVDDIGIRRPSLDEVFLTLTGQRSSDSSNRTTKHRVNGARN